MQDFINALNTGRRRKKPQAFRIKCKMPDGKIHLTEEYTEAVIAEVEAEVRAIRGATEIERIPVSAK